LLFARTAGPLSPSEQSTSINFLPKVLRESYQLKG
jgi:hypothetical protein